MNIQSKVRVGSMDYDVILTDEKIINQDGVMSNEKLY